MTVKFAIMVFEGTENAAGIGIISRITKQIRRCSSSNPAERTTIPTAHEYRVLTGMYTRKETMIWWRIGRSRVRWIRGRYHSLIR